MTAGQSLSIAMVLALASACVPSARGNRGAMVASQDYVDARRRAAVAAHQKLERALANQDSGAIDASLHHEIELVTPTSDTVRGVTAWGYLMLLAADSSKLVRLGAGRFEPCLEGDVYEFDGLFQARSLGVAATGRHSILWAVDETPVVARRVLLTYAVVSLRRALPCTFEYRVAAMQHRYTATMALGVDPSGGATAMRGAERAMDDRGLRYSASVFAPGVAARPFPQLRSQHATLTLAIRGRSSRVLSQDLQLHLRLPERVTGFDSVSSRYVEVKNMSAAFALLVQRQRRPIRFGIGPAALLTHWSVHEDQRSIRVFATAQNAVGEDIAFASAWLPGAGGERRRAWTPALGAAAEIAAMVPLDRVTLGEFFIRAAAFTDTDAPGTPSFPPTRVKNRSLTFGLSVGRGWR